MCPEGAPKKLSNSKKYFRKSVTSPTGESTPLDVPTNWVFARSKTALLGIRARRPEKIPLAPLTGQ